MPTDRNRRPFPRFNLNNKQPSINRIEPEHLLEDAQDSRVAQPARDAHFFDQDAPENLDVNDEPVEEDFRVAQPARDPHFFDQDAPENLDTNDERIVEDRPRLLPRQDFSAPSASRNSVKWTVFDLGVDEFPLPKLKESELRTRMIEPTTDKFGRRTWFWSQTSASKVYGLLCPKIVGACEDAPPIFISPTSQDAPIIVGVLDGMGGAGAGQVEYRTNKISLTTTEALLASRIVRYQILKAITNDKSPTFVDLKTKIREVLARAEASLKINEKTRIRGTMTMRLPTTLVLSQISRGSNLDTAIVKTLWAGDSRAFLITPADGLSALTRDHVRVSDQLEQLQSDPPIENVVNGSKDFFLEEFSTTVNSPFILLLATDGVFGYLPTPGFLELGLLEAISASGSKFAEKFADFCTSYAADDVSAVIIVRGFKDEVDLKTQFAPRLANLQEMYAPLLAMVSGNDDSKLEVEKLWEIERHSYNRLSETMHD